MDKKVTSIVAYIAPIGWLIAFLAGDTQFFYFSLFFADKTYNILHCVQLFPANQLCLLADCVQAAAFFPQFRG